MPESASDIIKKAVENYFGSSKSSEFKEEVVDFLEREGEYLCYTLKDYWQA